VNDREVIGGVLEEYARVVEVIGGVLEE